MGTYTERMNLRQRAAYEFEPTRRHYWLANRVLAVAETRVEGAWRAFVRYVPDDVMSGWRDGPLGCVAYVASGGAKLPEPVARAIFPEFKDLPYAR